MSRLSEYIEKIKEYKKKNPNLTEVELIRYVYLDLGGKLAFNINFIPFGNTRKRHDIYIKSKSKEDIEECMRTNTIICKSVAYLLEYILKPLGINIKAEVDPDDMRKYPHVYNVIKPRDNGKSYIIDLQNDMHNIQSHSFTSNFGLSTVDRKTYIIPRFEQEQMDKKLGYIDNEHYYADEYIYLMKSDIGLIEDFGERVRFVLENIDIYENPNIEYANRMWHHAKILERLFKDYEFDFNENNQRIRMVDCYKDINGNRKYIQCISVLTKDGTDMYVYDKKSYKYSKIEMKDFARAVKNGLVIHNCKVPGLKKAMDELGNNER